MNLAQLTDSRDSTLIAATRLAVRPDRLGRKGRVKSNRPDGHADKARGNYRREYTRRKG